MGFRCLGGKLNSDKETKPSHGQSVKRWLAPKLVTNGLDWCSEKLMKWLLDPYVKCSRVRWILSRCDRYMY